MARAENTPPELKGIFSLVADPDTAKVESKVLALALQLMKSKDYKGIEKTSEILRHSKVHVRGGRSLYTLWIGIVGGLLAVDANSDYNKAKASHQQWRKVANGTAHADVAWGIAMTNYAWEARGGGYANTVTRAGWKGFEERLGLATQAFSSAAKLEANNPALWLHLLMLDRGLGTPVPLQREHLRRATAADPVGLDAASTMAQNLLPRWYGRPGDVEKFVEGLAAKPGHWDGDELYCQVGLNALNYGGGTEEEIHLDWPRMRKGFGKILKKKRSWDRLNQNMLLAAARQWDVSAVKQYYGLLPWGYDQKIISPPEMADIAKAAGKKPLSPKPPR